MGCRELPSSRRLNTTPFAETLLGAKSELTPRRFPTLQSNVCGSGHRLTHHLHLAQPPATADVSPPQTSFSNQSQPCIKGLGTRRHSGKAQSFSLSLLLRQLQRQVKAIAVPGSHQPCSRQLSHIPKEQPRSEAADGGFKPLQRTGPPTGKHLYTRADGSVLPIHTSF